MFYCAYIYLFTEVGDETGSVPVSTPKIIRHPISTTAHLSSKVELECSAEGAAVYDWFKNNKFLRSTRTSGKFVIDNVTLSNSGTYHCVAISNSGGKSTSQKAKVTVGMFSVCVCVCVCVCV